MATITESTSIITINNFPSPNTYLVATPSTSIEFDSLESAREWAPLIAVRHVSEEEYRAHFVERFNSLKLSNPEFFKRGR